jgi:NitT/TauT family transport system substrate-binding protein
MRRRSLLAGVAAAGVLAPHVVRAQELTVVRFATILVDDITPSLYATSRGMFRQAGLDVRTTAMTGGAATAAAVLGGSIDIAVSNMVSVATAHERGVPLVIASPGSVYNTNAPSVLMVVKRESPIQSAPDLNGKTVASSTLRDLNMTTALSWIAQHGGDPSTIHQVELPYAAQLAAIDSGRVDAAILLAPFSQEALGNPKYRVVAHPYDAVAPAFANGVYIAHEQYVAANPETVRRFARVIRDASIYANAHHAETAPILATATGVDVEKVNRGTRATYFESLDYGKFQVLIDFFAKHDLLKRSFPAQEIIAAPAAAAWR